MLLLLLLPGDACASLGEVYLLWLAEKAEVERLQRGEEHQRERGAVRVRVRVRIWVRVRGRVCLALALCPQQVGASGSSSIRRGRCILTGTAQRLRLLVLVCNCCRRCCFRCRYCSSG